MTVNNFLTTGLKMGLVVQFRDVVGKQTVDYTYRKLNTEEFVEKLIWSGDKHELNPVEKMQLPEAVSEIVLKVEKSLK